MLPLQSSNWEDCFWEKCRSIFSFHIRKLEVVNTALCSGKLCTCLGTLRGRNYLRLYDGLDDQWEPKAEKAHRQCICLSRSGNHQEGSGATFISSEDLHEVHRAIVWETWS